MENAVRQKIRELRTTGLSYRKIQNLLGCSLSTIYYTDRGYSSREHTKGTAKAAIRHDWKAIQQYYDDGHTVLECKKKFNLPKKSSSMRRAIRDGRFVPHRTNGGTYYVATPLPANEILVPTPNRRDGRLLKRALLESGVPYTCSICTQVPQWNSQPLVLQVHHKDGNKRNNTICNLQFLCPNCHTQTTTYCSKNKVKSEGGR